MTATRTIPISAEDIQKLARLRGRRPEQRPDRQELYVPETGQKFVAPLDIPAQRDTAWGAS